MGLIVGKYTFWKNLFFIGKSQLSLCAKIVIFSIDKATFFGYIYTKS